MYLVRHMRGTASELGLICSKKTYRTRTAQCAPMEKHLPKRKDFKNLHSRRVHRQRVVSLESLQIVLFTVKGRKSWTLDFRGMHLYSYHF